MSTEELKTDDPDFIMIMEYKSAYRIDRDLNTPDVVVLMRRARQEERRRCADIADLVASDNGFSGASAQIAANLIRKGLKIARQSAQETAS